jgi:hypothetical protein
MNPAAPRAGQASHAGQPGYARQRPALAKPKAWTPTPTTIPRAGLAAAASTQYPARTAP